jgi:CDP-glycerol glycerophosphotransferase
VIEKLLNAIVEQRLLLTIRKYIDAAIGRVGRYFIAMSARVNDKRVFFFTNQGNYSCNPRAIHEELMKRGKDYDIVWAYLESTASPGDIPATMVKRHSLEYVRALASAKVIVTNGEGIFARALRKKKKQVYINTWHGSMGIKRIEPDDIKTGNVSKLCRKSAKYFDINISNSDFEDQVYRSTFWANTKIMKAGHPRNDVLVRADERERTDLRGAVLSDYLGFDYTKKCADDIKICLYAPTFRDSNNTTPYNINYSMLRDALAERFGGNWLIFVRIHPRLMKKNIAMENRCNGTDVFNLTSYPDIQDLLFAADALITDYSSCICDYALTGRPAFIYATDIKSYDMERGFYYSLYDSPWQVALDNEELKENILRFDSDKYECARDEFLNKMGCVEDGRASERVADEIINIIDGACPQSF